jgi:hypothetical protein
MESDCWVYSKEDLGSVGDWVMVKVEAKDNSFHETRAVVSEKKGNGLLSGWLYLLPGIIIMLIGAVLLTLGIVGKADTSLERLLEEDKEFRKQQLAMMQAARKAAIEKQKQSTWAPDHSLQAQPLQPVPVADAAQAVPVVPAEAQPQAPPIQPAQPAPEAAPSQPLAGVPEQSPAQNVIAGNIP